MPCENCECPFQVIGAEPRALEALDAAACMLRDAVQPVTFADGEMLFMEGQRSHCLYAVTDGMVKICRHCSSGREQIVGISCPQRLLVGLQSISDEHYCYTAIAATRVQACKINHHALLERARERGDLAMRLIDALNAQLTHSRGMVEVLGHRCAAAKIAAFILLMTPKPKRGNGRFALPLSRMEMASILGLSEETVCRMMATMKRNGAVYAPRGRIEVLDWERLQSIADGSLSPQADGGRAAATG